MLRALSRRSTNLCFMFDLLPAGATPEDCGELHSSVDSFDLEPYLRVSQRCIGRLRPALLCCSNMGFYLSNAAGLVELPGKTWERLQALAGPHTTLLNSIEPDAVCPQTICLGLHKPRKTMTLTMLLCQQSTPQATLVRCWTQSKSAAIQAQRGLVICSVQVEGRLFSSNRAQ